ncbi:LLM class flavin-dependent oxidoreductase [Amycolatopsis sp. A133]|uniref:LLM class flavin-dependent oxidoreductase n=1 Tax=Amycolatopsis sp. A133 TaxID=3064472 RepID=UPI0027F24348|nr:LLM class flavin-dependent oxidoreductase [Amycolatopsis sp. A133]MDQ7808609.1 LLM class flavin-dependent oxidoreductase [Amycolatopsis sp. A133]
MHIGTGLINPPSPAEVVAAAADAAGRGLAAFWTNQNPGGWDPLTLLASLGRRPAEVGTAIVATYPRHPVTTATEALTLQAAGGGGLTLGVGPSHAWYVQDQLGLPYTSPLRHTREYLTVLRPLLTGRPVRFDGEFFTVDTRLDITAPAPSLLLSALGPRMLELAHDLADGVAAAWVTPDMVARQIAPRTAPGARIVAQAVTLLSPDPDRARADFAGQLATVGTMPAYRASLDRAGLANPADTLVIGDDTTITDAVKRYEDAGVTDLIVVPLNDRSRTLDLLT